MTIMGLSKEHQQFLESLWEKSRLDIRITGNGRWYDQKVFPDVMSAVCAAIDEEFKKKSFTKKDLENSDSFAEQIKGFKKPHPKHKKAAREYDKFVGQPVNVLLIADILKSKSDNSDNWFEVASETGREIIHEMATSEHAACDFLYRYICKTIQHSGICPLFLDFFEKEDKKSYDKLKSKFAQFIIDNTKIDTEVECNRIFAKVINILSYV